MAVHEAGLQAVHDLLQGRRALRAGAAVAEQYWRGVEPADQGPGRCRVDDVLLPHEWHGLRGIREPRASLERRSLREGNVADGVLHVLPKGSGRMCYRRACAV